MGFIVWTMKNPHSAHITENSTVVMRPHSRCFLRKNAHARPAAPAFASIIVMSPSVIIVRGNIHTSRLNGLAR